VDLDLIPNSCSRLDNLLFSESQSRFIFATSDPEKVEKSLREVPGLVYAKIGNSSAQGDDKIVLLKSGSPIVYSSIEELEDKYSSLSKIMS
jgi:hypothetical protein